MIRLISISFTLYSSFYKKDFTFSAVREGITVNLFSTEAPHEAISCDPLEDPDSTLEAARAVHGIIADPSAEPDEEEITQLAEFLQTSFGGELEGF